MSVIKGQMTMFKYTYDFGRDGGAVSDISLTADVNAMPVGFIVKDVSVVVDTQLTSGGTPTITVGNSADRDGYLIDIYAELGAAGTGVHASEVAGALLWDDTNDHMIEYALPSTAAAVPSITIGTAAVTAGKLLVYVHGYMPGAVPA